MALQELINYYTTPTVSDAFWLEARQLQTDHLFNETGRLSSYNHKYIYIASINMSHFCQQPMEQALGSMLLLLMLI